MNYCKEETILVFVDIKTKTVLAYSVIESGIYTKQTIVTALFEQKIPGIDVFFFYYYSTLYSI